MKTRHTTYSKNMYCFTLTYESATKNEKNDVYFYQATDLNAITHSWGPCWRDKNALPPQALSPLVKI